MIGTWVLVFKLAYQRTGKKGGKNSRISIKVRQKN